MASAISALPLPVNYRARNNEKTMDEPARGWLISNRMRTPTNGSFFGVEYPVRRDQVCLRVGPLQFFRFFARSIQGRNQEERRRSWNFIFLENSRMQLHYYCVQYACTHTFKLYQTPDITSHFLAP